MLFGRKKKRMIDVRELHKRGVVRIPKSEVVVPTNKDGFVDVSSSVSTPSSSKSSSKSFFGFMDNQVSSPSPVSSDAYSKREVDSRLTDLDNKLYKLEQRIELLERKLDVNRSSGGSSPISW